MKFDVDHPIAPTDIAVIGMACRVPGANDPEQYWRNLRDGIESMTRLTIRDLREARVDPELINDPNYVRYARVLDEVDQFDGGFFGFSPKEAAIMDPQHRHFLEVAWEALERAGHSPKQFPGPIGVFAGCGMNGYMMCNLLTNPELIRTTGMFLLRHTGNDKDFLSTRVSYCLNLKGPSVNVQTACSTSLVAIHQACQSLLNGECDMAMAGGVTIEIPHRVGYLYREGEILSPDGHCRAFDYKSQGTVFGSGAGVVVLRRLEEALADGDEVLAVIKGSAINNDGADKVGYLAPSVSGQAAAVSEALAVADVPADSVTYVEAHGTGTPVGDPMEITALTQAFRASTEESGFCAVGSVKANIGHLDTAAGVAGFIKNVLSLKHGEIPPILNFEKPNPRIELENSPFFINDRLREWTRRKDYPRRAGISSLGVGGTNAHIILEEAPPLPAGSESRPSQLLTLSARSEEALERLTARLADYFEAHPEMSLADAAYTLKIGRNAFSHRRSVVCSDLQDAVAALRSGDRKRLPTARAIDGGVSVAFMFPGGGAQYPDMGRELYESEAVYREAVDECFAAMEPELAERLRRLMMPPAAEIESAAEELKKPLYSVLSIFIVEYAMARLLMVWGIEPDAMIGHSLGEYAAACIAEVISLRDALAIVTVRGRIFERLTSGGMLNVHLPEEEFHQYLTDEMDVAAVNAPNMCVVAGTDEVLEGLAKRLADDGVQCNRIRIDVAAHSRMLDPFLEEFRQGLRQIQLAEPRIPFLSNLTGTWIKPEEAIDPEYWVRQLRRTVRFGRSMRELMQKEGRILLEVGPGNTLASLCRINPDLVSGTPVVGTMRHPQQQVSDLACLLEALGQLWIRGASPEWSAFYEDERRRRVVLPTYPFEHQRYWIEPGEAQSAQVQAVDPLSRIPDPDDWISQPVWVESRDAVYPPSLIAQEKRTWLVFMDGDGLGEALRKRLEQYGQRVATVRFGESFRRDGKNDFVVDPARPADYEALVARLSAADLLPDQLLHLSCVDSGGTTAAGASSNGRLEAAHGLQQRGFYSLFFFIQALARTGAIQPTNLSVLTAGLHRTAEYEPTGDPAQATVLGLVRVLPSEFAEFTCSNLDLPADPGLIQTSDEKWLDQILAESLAGSSAVVALREGRRLVLRREPVDVSDLPPAADPLLRKDGVYLITGGFGGLGLALADYLSREYQARLVLVGRRGLPDAETWDDYLARHDYDDPLSLQIRRIRKLESHGGEVLPISADISEPDQVRRVFEQAVEAFGGVHGVFHAAGVLDDALIAMKEPHAPEKVFSPKLYGTLALDEALRARPEAEFMLLFSSTSAWLGAPGQADYTAANIFLDAFAQSRARDEKPLIRAIDWGTWSEVGMAVGAARSMGVIGAASQAEAREGAHPALQRRLIGEKDRHVFISTFSRARTWMLEEHGIKGKARLLPGTGYLEIARAAAQEVLGEGPVELKDVMFIAPMAVGPSTELEVRTTLTRRNGGYDFVIGSRVGFCPEGEEQWQDHCRGTVQRDFSTHSQVHSIEAISERCNRSREEFNGTGRQIRQEEHLDFGPRWKNLKCARFGENEALAELELAEEFHGDLEIWQLHPALLDIGTGFALPLIEGYESADKLYVPVAYQSIRVLGPLGQRVYSYVRNHGSNTTRKNIATFDLTLMDEQGASLVEIEGFAVKRIDDKDALELTLPEEAASDGGEGEFNLLRVGIERGIRPKEGMELLGRLLALRTPPQLIVSPLDLDALIEKARPQAPVRPARRKSSQDFDAPQAGIEQKIAAIWAQHLGAEEIGRNDEFFDLGGHSLLGMRVIMQINNEFKTSFPATELFEHPTVARLAQKIRTERPELAESAPDENMAEIIAAASPEEAVAPRKLVSGGERGRTVGAPHAGIASKQMEDKIIPSSSERAEQKEAEAPAVSREVREANGAGAASNLPKTISRISGDDRGAAADLDRISHITAQLDRLRSLENDEYGAPRKREYGMRRSPIAQKVLAPLYRFRRHRLRKLLDYLILRLEGGEWYTITLRELYAKYYDLHIGDYSASCFSVTQMKRGTRIGRYCSIYPSARIETANHPTNTISSNGIFYQRDSGFAEGYEIPRARVEIGNDVWIGHNATILFPTQKIGDGAVIAAGAVVAGDVPPFAVVAGYPATIVRYRFSKEKIEEIRRSQWWNASLADLEAVKQEFTRPVEGAKVR